MNNFKASSMKKSSTIFLKIVLILMGLIVLSVMLWFPHIEGRNANAPTFFSVYLHDPFLIYIYTGTLPFFFALYQAFKLLGNIEKNKIFSQNSVVALRNIKYSAIIIVAFLVGAMVQIISFAHEDDAPGAVVMGLGLVLATTVVAVFAALLQKIFQNAVDIKSENDLTV